MERSVYIDRLVLEHLQHWQWSDKTAAAAVAASRTRSKNADKSDPLIYFLQQLKWTFVFNVNFYVSFIAYCFAFFAHCRRRSCRCRVDVVFAVVVVVVLAPFSALFFVTNVFIGTSFLAQACYTQATIQPCRCNFSIKLI